MSKRSASNGGEGGIRTRGARLKAHFFSKEALSATQPPLPEEQSEQRKAAAERNRKLAEGRTIPGSLRTKRLPPFRYRYPA